MIGVDLHDAIDNFVRLLRRTLAENVVVKTLLSPDQIFSKLDKAKFENALLNLVLNSRDAMPDGGQITIKFSICVYDQNSRDDLTLVSDCYARITITDEGVEPLS